jgi:hypothetical protein
MSAEHDQRDLAAVRLGALEQAWKRLAEADELIAEAHDLTQEVMTEEEARLASEEPVNWATQQPWDPKVRRAKSCVTMATSKREAAAEWFKLAELAKP